TKLEVSGVIRSTGSGGALGTFDRTNNTEYALYGAGGLMSLWRADIGNVLNIDAGGKVGIGTTTPGGKLDVTGAIRSTGSNSELTTFDRVNNRQYTLYGSGDVMSLWRGDKGNVL